MGRHLGGLRLHGGRLRIGLADVDAALEESAVFNADAGRGHVAGEGAFRADIDAVGGGDIALELAENDDFAGADAGSDLPFLPTVTRLPGMLMLPSTLPSMNRDSVPVISPLMERPLPMLACSPTDDVAGRGVSSVGCTGTGRAAGCSGVGVGEGDCPCWVGFHIALNEFPFLSWRDWGAKAGPHIKGPEY